MYLLVIAIEIDLVKPSIDPQIGVLARTFFSFNFLFFVWVCSTSHYGKSANAFIYKHELAVTIRRDTTMMSNTTPRRTRHTYSSQDQSQASAPPLHSP